MFSVSYEHIYPLVIDCNYLVAQKFKYPFVLGQIQRADFEHIYPLAKNTTLHFYLDTSFPLSLNTSTPLFMKSRIQLYMLACIQLFMKT